MVAYGARMAWASYKSGAMTIKTLITPEWWLLAPLPAAFTLLAVEMLFRMRRLLHAEHGPRDDAVTAGLMSWEFAAWLMLGGSTVLLFLGLPVAFTFIAVNILGAIIWLGGQPGLEQLARNSVVSITSFSLTPIPLFVLMGEVLFHTGIAVKVIDGVERLISQVPGRLAVVAVVAGTIFSAISGSTIATTAMLGSLMVPVMLARGYHPTMATGPVMAIGAVDMLIPPSALTVLLGSFSGISISKLLIGGVMPGLILSVAFVAYIVIRVKLKPELAPPTPLERYHGLSRFLPFVLYVVPLVSIFVIVVASMSAGWATPTESAAIGAFATLAMALIYRALTVAQPAGGAARHARDLEHHPVHHRRRHDLRADPVVLRREQRPGRRAARHGPDHR